MKNNIFSLIIILTIGRCHAQSEPSTGGFKLDPSLALNISTKDAVIEMGVQRKIGSGQTYLIRPTVSLPITAQTPHIYQWDGFSSCPKAAVYLERNTKSYKNEGNYRGNSIVMRVDFGRRRYRYYPEFSSSQYESERKISGSVELKYYAYLAFGQNERFEIVPQARMRYSDNTCGSQVVYYRKTFLELTPFDIVTGAPMRVRTISPALALPICDKNTDLAIAPMIACDIPYRTNDISTRIRIESWAYYLLWRKDGADIKIGISPMTSIRIAGEDSFDKKDYGALFTLRFNGGWMQVI